MWESESGNVMVYSTLEASMYPDFEARANVFKREMYHIAAQWSINFQIQVDFGMCTRSHGVGALLDGSHDLESYLRRSPGSVQVSTRSSVLRKLGFRRR